VGFHLAAFGGSGCAVPNSRSAYFCVNSLFTDLQGMYSLRIFLITITHRIAAQNIQAPGYTNLGVSANSLLVQCQLRLEAPEEFYVPYSRGQFAIRIVHRNLPQRKTIPSKKNKGGTRTA